MTHVVQLILATLAGLVVRSILGAIIVHVARRRGLKIHAFVKVLIGGTRLAGAFARWRERRQRLKDMDEYDYVKGRYLDYNSIMNGILAHGGEEKLRAEFPGWARERDRWREYSAAGRDERERFEIGMADINALPSVVELNRVLYGQPAEPEHCHQ